MKQLNPEETRKTFGKYVIKDLVGIGGSGRVYKVWDPDREMHVALKVFNETGSGADNTSRLRFRREFRAALKLQHPHLVRVFETGIFDDQEFFTMEFIDGHDFDEHLKHFSKSLGAPGKYYNPKRLKHIFDLLIQIADALAYLHGHRYIHRDMKPGNVLVSNDNQVKLADFGLLRDLGSSKMTRTGSIVGTVEYMSPEQTVTAKVDARSDIYSMGVMAFKAFTGALPFSGGLMQQLISRTKENAPDPRTVCPDLDKNICRIIQRMLKRRPEERYPNAQMLLDDLVNTREKLFGEVESMSTTSLTLEAPISLVLPPRCVGRDTEIADIEKAFDLLRNQKQSSLFLLEGEAGVGKTRLTEEIKTQSAFYGVPFLRAVCQKEASGTFQPWINIFESCLSDIDKRPINWSEELSEVRLSVEKTISGFRQPTPDDNAMFSNEAARYKFFDLTFRFLSLFSHHLPIIIHFDNFHFAGYPSVELLQFISRRALFSSQPGLSNDYSGRMMIIVSYRPSEIPAGHPITKFQRFFESEETFHTISLKPLNSEHTNQVIISMLGSEHASPVFSTRVFEITKGNPLFIETMITTLVEEGALRRRGNIWVGAINGDDSLDSVNLFLPASLKESARRRFMTLNDTEKQVAQAASVLTEQFSFEELLYISGMDEDTLLDALDDLLKSGVFIEKSTTEEIYSFGFQHLREIVFEDISDSDGKKFHARAARYLESKHPDPTINILTRIAQHYDQSDRPRNSFPFYLKAANLYFRQGDYLHAGSMADAALRFIPSEDHREIHPLDIIRAVCRLKMGNPLAAREIFLSVLRRATRKIKRADDVALISHLSLLQSQALTGLIRTYIARAEYSRAEHILDGMITISKNNRNMLSYIQALLLQGEVAYLQNQLRESNTFLSAALKLSGKNPEPLIISECHRLLGLIRLKEDEPEPAREYFDAAMETASRVENKCYPAQIQAGLAQYYFRVNDISNAVLSLNQAIDTCELMGDYLGWPLHLRRLSLFQFQAGLTQDALKNMHKALAIFEEQENLRNISTTLLDLGRITFEAGKREESYRLFRRALDIFTDINSTPGIVSSLLNLAIVTLDLDIFEQTRSFLYRIDNYLSRDEIDFHNEYNLLKARLQVKLNNFEDAHNLLESIDIRKFKRKTAAAYYYYTLGESEIATYHQGMQKSRAIEHLEAAAEIYEENGYIFSANKTRHTLGTFLITSGIDPQRGHALLDKLPELFS